MKFVSLRLVLLAILIASCVANISCNHDEGHAKSTASKGTKPAAEESFDLIMTTFRRRMEETPLGFVVKDRGGHSTFTGKNKVTDELIRPANPNEPYRAVITVASESRYSITRTKESTQDENRERNPNNGDSAKPGDETRVETSDGGQAGKNAEAPKDTTHTTDDVVARRPEEEVHKYELLYKDGRWMLITKLDQKTELSIQNAFDSALAVQ